MHSRLLYRFLLLSVFAGNTMAADVPFVVLDYADMFARSQSPSHMLALELRPGDTVRDAYAQAFFQGFTHPSGGIFTTSDLVRDAYARGQAYWRDHAGERDAILAGYGYVAVEREGTWSHGFEKSDFQPVDADGEPWWMTTFGSEPWRDVGLAQAATAHGPRRVRISGYLSPKGRHGHLGAYAREILVTSGTTVDPDGH